MLLQFSNKNRCGFLPHGAALGVEPGRLVSGKRYFAGFVNVVNMSELLSRSGTIFFFKDNSVAATMEP